MPKLDDEVAGTVSHVEPWGFLLDLEGGGMAFLDNTKTPSWRTGGEAPKIGDRFHVVVVDDARSPCRVSALAEDIQIARDFKSSREDSSGQM